MNLMLLAAGLGTRLQPYTNTTPKPAIPFFGAPMVAYSLQLFADVKIDNLVVNTHHLPDKIEKLMKDLHWPSTQLVISPEPGKILGSGGGIRHAFKHLKGQGHFLVANADEVMFPEDPKMIQKALAFHQSHGGLATLVAMEHPEVGGKFGGLWLKSGTQVEQFSKKAVAGHFGLHFPGILILSDRIEKYFLADDTAEENILYETLTRAMHAGEKVHAFKMQARWFETGNPVDFLKASETCLQALKKKEAWIQALIRVVRGFGHPDTVIEKSQPQLDQLILNKIIELKR